MKKIYILFALFIFISKTNKAQTIIGTITDNTTNEALIGVNIIAENGNGTASNLEGKFSLQLESGEQEITFKYIGYKKIKKTITLQQNESKILNIALAP